MVESYADMGQIVHDVSTNMKIQMLSILSIG